MTRHKRERFKQLRRAYGTQDKVGAAVGVTGTMIRYIENGNATPSGKLMLKLSFLFDTPVNELFPDVEMEAQSEAVLDALR
ncbi:putative transcriptional regulator [Candidatus Desulfosporosinus infrequens]|uniref:Putative transcriptional regulator n=1 Tax=Candidatus Desulfosporosinus infrequens TaxID=2043169 RepID=A0A2U3LH98_9FIRM|nr:putative transcriptional regulator [Candidatus Desulfosporosinus infrequens]